MNVYMLLHLYLYISAQFNGFKEKIHKLFPVIYDTKFLSYDMKKILKKEGTVVSVLYEFHVIWNCVCIYMCACVHASFEVRCKH
jgi:hypothetical protein